jgi:hypothetical protein
VRWEGDNFTLGLGSSASLFNTTRTGSTPFKSDHSLWFGSIRGGGSAFWPGTVEDVIVYDRPITNAEYDTAASLAGAWSWRML